MEEEAAATGRWDRKKRQTRNALIDAALRLVAERGIDGVTVEDISNAADVSPRTFFNYFSSKEEALTWHDPQIDQRVLQRLGASPADMDTLTALRAALAPEIAAVEAQREQWFLRMAVLERTPSLLPRLLVSGVTSGRLLAEALAARLGVDINAHVYPRLVAAVADAAVRSAVEVWGATGGARPLTELAEEALDLAARGLPEPPRLRVSTVQ